MKESESFLCEKIRSFWDIISSFYSFDNFTMVEWANKSPEKLPGLSNCGFMHLFSVAEHLLIIYMLTVKRWLFLKLPGNYWWWPLPAASLRVQEHSLYSTSHLSKCELFRAEIRYFNLKLLKCLSPSSARIDLK